MVPLSAFEFCLFSAALILLARGPRAIAAAHVLTITGLFIALFVILYDAFKAQIFVGTISSLIMSPPMRDRTCFPWRGD